MLRKAHLENYLHKGAGDDFDFKKDYSAVDIDVSSSSDTEVAIFFVVDIAQTNRRVRLL